jgi:N-acetyl-1-D-myo-inositol-2-amino-2-deoxy-alpha-D-glucopyranoside deacetylase
MRTSAFVNVVVGAAILSGQPPRLLAARRSHPAQLAGYWEFPGGKVEPGETEPQALRRECGEELDVEIVVGARAGPDVEVSPGTVLRLYWARIVNGTPVPKEHAELRWLKLSEHNDVHWLPADRPLVKGLARRVRGMTSGQRRLLLVHAHPDDETIATGATMAKYAAEGAQVTLITCTLGEEGEVVVKDLEHLSAQAEDRLGEHRIAELAEACRALGVSDHRFLGGPGRWRDSGMMGSPANQHADAFWNADMVEAVAELVGVLRAVRPQVIITYDEKGAYGHPDHIRAHDVTVAAITAAAEPQRFPELGAPYVVDKLYYTVFPRSVLQAGLDAMRAAGHTTWFEGVERAEDLPFAVPDELVTTRVDAQDYLPQKLEAMRAHASQISVDAPFFALADNIGMAAMGTEYYRLVKGARGAGEGPTDMEVDLFAGVPLVELGADTPTG